MFVIVTKNNTGERLLINSNKIISIENCTDKRNNRSYRCINLDDGSYIYVREIIEELESKLGGEVL